MVKQKQFSNEFSLGYFFCLPRPMKPFRLSSQWLDVNVEGLRRVGKKMKNNDEMLSGLCRLFFQNPSGFVAVASFSFFFIKQNFACWTSIANEEEISKGQELFIRKRGEGGVRQWGSTTISLWISDGIPSSTKGVSRALFCASFFHIPTKFFSMLKRCWAKGNCVGGEERKS